MTLNDIANDLIAGGISSPIRLMKMRQGDSYPTVVLNVISQNANHNLTETSHIKSRIQISVFSEFYATARSIAESIRLILNHSTPSYAALILHDSTDDAQATPTATDEPVYHVAADYIVTHSP